MKTQEQIEKYSKGSRYTSFAQEHKNVDNLHDAILKMQRLTNEMLEMEDEVLDAIEAAERASEVFKSARMKALSICYNAQNTDFRGGMQMANRINELINLEVECFDAEDIDDDLVGLACQRRNEYFSSTKKMMRAANDFINDNNKVN